MMRVLRNVFRIVGLIILLVVVAFAVLVWQVDALGGRDDARPADAIVVLGARVEVNGQPGPDLTSRTNHGIELWREAYAPRIICTGGFKNEPLSAASVCRRYAMAQGVPQDAIWLADGASNTIEDAGATAAVMADHGWRSAILVSHPLHLFRARWLFERAGVDVVTSPTTTATDRIDLPLRAWYDVREAGAIVVTTLDGWGWLPRQWTARIQNLNYNLSNGY